MRPKTQIASLKAQIALLEGQLAAKGVEPLGDSESATAPAWAEPLTRQQRTLMGALIGAWPRTLDAFQIDEILPHQDHAADRDLKLVATIVSSVRRKLGHEAIETIRGEGYRAGRAFVPYAKVA